MEACPGDGQVTHRSEVIQMFENGLLNLTNWTGNVIMPTLAGLFFAAAIYHFSKGQLYAHLSWSGFAALMCSGLLRAVEGFAQQRAFGEAQAFKRACSCFGLGRYLYYFSGTWMDLDDRKRPKNKPALVGWATPEGWRQGLRPEQAVERHSSGLAATTKSEPPRQNGKISNASPAIHAELVRQIEAMADLLGKGLYRGLLKSVALVWNPSEIQDVAVLQKVLRYMQSAERGLCRLRAALEHTGPESLRLILRSLDLKSIDRVNDLATLHDIVVALEARAGANREHA